MTVSKAALIAAPGIFVLAIFVACCGGGGSDLTTISGNLSERTAFNSPRRPSRKVEHPWSWSLLGSAYAHSGTNDLDVCAEECPGGFDGSGNCPAPQQTNACSMTGDAGDFTMRGHMSGDICVRFTDRDDPGFVSRMCVTGVSRGANVTMTNMSCGRGNHRCDAEHVRMNGRDMDGGMQ